MENLSKNVLWPLLTLSAQKKKKYLFPDIPLSARTVTRRIETLSSDVRRSLKDRCGNFELFSIALDESVDVKDTAQRAVLLRGVNSEFEILEEFARLYSIKGHHHR